MLGALAVASPSPAAAENVRLAWDPAPQPTVAGYVLHYGTQPSIYTQRVDVGLNLYREVAGLTPGVTYYFAVEAYATDGTRSALSAPIAVKVDSNGSAPLTYRLTEGATGSFFGMDVALTNPNDVHAPVVVSFRRADGQVISHSETLGPRSHRLLRVNGIAGVQDAAVSTTVQSTSALPLLVERTMAWPAASPTAAHAESAVPAPSRTWYFADGQHGHAETQLLISNDNTSTAAVSVTFLREGRSPVVQSYKVPAGARLAVSSGSVSGLSGNSFATVVEADRPVTAERALYFAKDNWRGGHVSAGVTTASSSWFYAGGVTNDNTDTYLLLANPNRTRAKIVVTYVLQDGKTVSTTHWLKEERRLTINTRQEGSRLKNARFHIEVTSDIPVVSERTVYRFGSSSSASGWLEGHSTVGATKPARRWGLADARVGGPAGYRTELFIANPNKSAATVVLSFLRGDGAVIPHTVTVPAGRHVAVDVGAAVPGLAGTSFGVIADSTNGQPVVVERVTSFAAGGTVSVLATPLDKP